MNVSQWFWLILLICWAMVVPAVASGQDASLFLEPDSDGVQRGTITLDSYTFTPSHLSVQTGSPVELRLENRSFLTPHNFVIDRPVAGLQYDVDVSAGESIIIQLRPGTPGMYTFYCDRQLLFFPSHREEGMEGRLEVR